MNPWISEMVGGNPDSVGDLTQHDGDLVTRSITPIFGDTFTNKPMAIFGDTHNLDCSKRAKFGD
jgi:hypothetical protein